MGGLYRRIYDYLAREPVGVAVISPADVELDRHTLLEPDVFVVPLGATGRPRSWQDAKRLLLAVEVLSPSTARYDRVTKRRKFQRSGVRE